MPMVMMTRGDPPSNSPAKSVLGIFEGDTGKYHRKEDLKRPFAFVHPGSAQSRSADRCHERIAAAFIATYRMERACAMQHAFQQSGAAVHPITDEVVSAAYN